MDNDKRINHYTYGEVNTANSQLLSFTCHPDSVSEVKEFLSTKVRTIDIPCTSRVNISHGSYGRYTRYNITQHKYAGGGAGYIEVLEIFNPPEYRNGCVIYNYSTYGKSYYTEWLTLDDAISAFDLFWSSNKGEDALQGFFGFVRKVDCGALTPWFYAVGDEVLVGDYAFPEGLQDDPVYRFGVKVVISNSEGIPCIKTCMGTRFIEVEKSGYKKEKEIYRLIYFNDGSVWDERSKCSDPRILGDNELWIVDALEKFQRLLSGNAEDFSINFLDGNKFIGKIIKSNQKLACAEGDYNLKITFKDSSEVKTGWVNGFVPSVKTPDIISYVTEKFKENGKEVHAVEIKGSRIKVKGKKWSGVYYSK